MTIRRHRPFVLLTLAALAGAANAQGLSPTVGLDSVSLIGKPPVDLSSASSPAFTVGYGPTETPLPEGVARTAIDHSFTSSGLTGAAGFLCGLHPGPDNNGAASALGYDPSGRFVGAKLSIAFR